MGDPEALIVHARVERWPLDEFPLPGRLVHEILKPLLRGNPAHRGPDPRTFVAAGFLPGGRQYRRRSRAAPIGRALDRRDADTRLIEYPGETGVGLQHLAILVGRHAHAAVWPEVIS